MFCAIFALTTLTTAFAADSDSLKPTLFADLGDAYYNPDGMTVHDQTGVLYLNVPNFSRMDAKMVKADSAQGGYLLERQANGTFKKILEYPVSDRTGQAGPMGLDAGPDGCLYVCDNQYFHNKDFCSRILRVVFVNGKPTGEVQIAVEGVKLANGIAWSGKKMFYTDSCFDIDSDGDIIGSGGLFCFDADEVLSAGRDGNAPLKVNASPSDEHCLAYEKVVKLGRGDNTGCDGITADTNGVVWFGNFGNGFIYAAYPDAAGAYRRENVVNVFDALNQPGMDKGPYKGLKLQCCDGIFYDKGTNRVYVDDSQNNAIWSFTPVKQGEKIHPTVVWKNGDTDGMDGSLDQPCEAVVFDGKLVIANFDWPFPGLLNSTVDLPGTLSAIDYAALTKWAEQQSASEAKK